MNMIPLMIGVSDSDRTRPIANGEVTIEGIAPRITFMGVQALFNKQLTEHAFDCCELPLTSYLRTLDRPERPYAAIPIFPSRHFRFSNVFVHAKSGIETVADLAGKRIGTPVFDMAAAVWLRGIFHDDYDLPRTAPIYVAGGLDSIRSGDEHPQFHPPQFTCEERTDASLATLLAAGEIDALYTARAPSTWPSETVKRLFDDPITAELAYFDKTGIFPAMHLIAIKRPLIEANPGLAKALYDAFAKAQQIARANLWDSAALSTMLPWQLESLLLAEKRMGKDYWAAGLAKNRVMLETIGRYMHEDGLTRKAYAPEELFESDLLGT